MTEGDRRDGPDSRVTLLTDALMAIDARRRYGRQLFDLGSAVLLHHRPDRFGDCEGHFNAIEEQHGWPCDQATELARILGVDLN